MKEIKLKINWWTPLAICLVYFPIKAFSVNTQELSYDDLINELNYKQYRLNQINSGSSLSQNSMSLGMVTSFNSIEGKKSYLQPLQGFEIGFNSDMSSNQYEGRGLFRYFFQNGSADQQASLRELAFQIISHRELNKSWDTYYGGGFSVKHLLLDSPIESLNELSIQLNAVSGVETKISSTSRLGFELGARFPFGITGHDRFALDGTIRLKTDLE